jgi:hypothetical protein
LPDVFQTTQTDKESRGTEDVGSEKNENFFSLMELGDRVVILSSATPLQEAGHEPKRKRKAKPA